MEPIETYEHEGMTIEIYPDEGPVEDPRDWENLGIMVCWHPDYYFGDFQFTNPEGRGAVRNRFHQDDFNSMEMLARYLGIVDRAVCILPLTIYDHSGVTMYVGGKYDYPFDSAGWDTTHVGFIYTTPEKIEEMGIPEDKIEEALRQEVKTYAAWLEGDVVGYVVKDSEGEIVDGCWGYVGNYEFCKSEAEDAAKFHAHEIWVNEEPVDIAEVIK